MRGPKHSHSDRDRIFTPPELAKKLIGKIPSVAGDTWLDPCYGTGVFFDNFPDGENAYCEIDMGKDFLEYEKKKKTRLGCNKYPFFTTEGIYIQNGRVL